MTQMTHMTLDDLKTGMIITTKSGLEYLVLRNDKDFVAVRKGGWISLKDYSSDLTYHTVWDDDHGWDIVKVECFDRWARILDFENNPKDKGVLWNEPDKVKLTLAEIESRLGYKIEIVSEEE